MHDIVVDQFELYVKGEASNAFHAHLAACAGCRAEVAELARISVMLRELRPDPDVPTEPAPGFYNRLRPAIASRPRFDVWGFYAPGAEFFRRVAFASLLLLAGLGGYLVTRETEADSGTDAVAIIAQHDGSLEHAEAADRDRLLVTLADYRQ